MCLASPCIQPQLTRLTRRPDELREVRGAPSWPPRTASPLQGEAGALRTGTKLPRELQARSAWQVQPGQAAGCKTLVLLARALRAWQVERGPGPEQSLRKAPCLSCTIFGGSHVSNVFWAANMRRMQ